jgi:hypothetical protein
MTHPSIDSRATVRWAGHDAAGRTISSGSGLPKG